MDVVGLNNTGVEFVLTDLDVAPTFMDVADASGIAETKTRNHQNARTAYDEVLRLLQHLSPDAKQQAAIHTKLGVVKNRLIAAGQTF